MPNNFNSNPDLKPTGYDNTLVAFSPIRPGGKLETIFRPDGDQFIGDVDMHYEADRLLLSMPDADGGRAYSLGTVGHLFCFDAAKGDVLWSRNLKAEYDIKVPIRGGLPQHRLWKRTLDLKTGDRIWENLDAVPTARWSNIHLVRHEDRVWMFNERGELIIGRLSPEGLDEISRAVIIKPTEGQLGQRGGVCWSHPAFAGKCVYVRNDSEMLCIDLSVRQ